MTKVKYRIYLILNKKLLIRDCKIKLIKYGLMIMIFMIFPINGLMIGKYFIKLNCYFIYIQLGFNFTLMKMDREKL